MREPARSGAFCSASSRCAHGVTWDRAQASAVGFSFPLLLPAGGCRWCGVCAAIRDWTIAQIPGGAGDLDQLICDGKTLRGSIEATSGGGSAFIAQVTLCSAALGVAIAQACYATGENHERAVLQKLLEDLDLEGVLIQADALHTQQAFFGSSQSRGPTSS